MLVSGYRSKFKLIFWIAIRRIDGNAAEEVNGLTNGTATAEPVTPPADTVTPPQTEDANPAIKTKQAAINSATGKKKQILVKRKKLAGAELVSVDRCCYVLPVLNGYDNITLPAIFDKK